MYQLPGCWRSDKRKNKPCVYKTPVISGDYERWEVSAFRNLGNRTEVNPHTRNQIQCQNIRKEHCSKKKRKENLVRDNGSAKICESTHTKPNPVSKYKK